MNTLLLHPTDTLFFRDGRPMGGSLSGHGAAWPLPTVTNAALHAALWRAGPAFKDAHAHRRGRSGCYSDSQRDRRFGSLVTAGPFPVLADGSTWLFPRPLDAGLGEDEKDSTQACFLPLQKEWQQGRSSLQPPLKFPVAARFTPTKKAPAPWWNRHAWETYLGTAARDAQPEFFHDEVFADTEFSYGIGMDAATGTQDGERFYSSHSLRLRDGCGLGVLGEAHEKDFRTQAGSADLLHALFPNSGARTPVVVGGQQRLCTVERHEVKAAQDLPLPVGQSTGFTADDDGDYLVKWVLLTPAVFPEIQAGMSKRSTERRAHPGGWLPTWICPETGRVLLETVSEEERKRRRHLNAAGKGYASAPNIPATLVAALVGKPVPVTGYALPCETIDVKGGPKRTHLAVPAGSVYYFKTREPDKLAAALNWHGAGADSLTLKNRRSTLYGEKGFGLGVCAAGAWHGGRCPVPLPATAAS